MIFHFISVWVFICLSEKLCIIKNANNPNNINKMSDIGSKCMHTMKFVLHKNWFFKIICAPFNFQMTIVNLTSIFFHVPCFFFIFEKCLRKFDIIRVIHKTIVTWWKKTNNFISLSFGRVRDLFHFYLYNNNNYMDT